MKRNNLPPGMSLLDYLWNTFGGYKVSTEMQTPPDPNSLVSEQVLNNVIDKVTEGNITKLHIVDLGGDKMLLAGLSKSGEVISIVDLDKENYLVDIKVIQSTQVEVDDEVCDELDEPLLVCTMRNGHKYYTNLSQFKYSGVETNSIKTTVVGNRIAAHLKIDKSIEVPVVDVAITKKGLKVDLTMKDLNDKQLKLVKTTDGLDTTFTWDDGNNIMFLCLTYNLYHSLQSYNPGKIYFITDEMCIYLNGVRYGDNLSLISTDTIEVINNGNSVSMEVRIDNDEFNLLSKSKAGLAAKLYWEE